MPRGGTLWASKTDTTRESTEEDRLTHAMAIDYAFVRFLPVNGARASLELHLQANILAFCRRGFTGVLDVQVAVRLVILSGREVTASCVNERGQHQATRNANTSKTLKKPTVEGIRLVRPDILEVHSARGIIVVVHREASVRRIARSVRISEACANKVMAGLPLAATDVEEARAPARRRTRPGTAHDGGGALGIVDDLHSLHVLVHLGEHEVKGLVAVDGVWVLDVDRLGPEVTERLVGGGVEGFDGKPAVVSRGGESRGGEGEDRGGSYGSFHGCGD